MWILPKSLILAFVQDTEALNLDLNLCSQFCAQLLTRRSKRSQSSVYLREWKVGNLMRLRSGAISSLSIGKAFEAWWTSSLAATHASHSVLPGSEQEQKTQDICGPTLKTESNKWLPGFVSLKMLKGTFRWDSPQSSAIWNSWVIRSRGEYSQRLNAARLTRESACSSWPTTRANDYKGCGNAVPRKDGKHQLDTLEAVVIFGRHDPESLSTHGSRPESWATATVSTGAHRQKNGSMTPKLDNQVAGKLNPRWVERLMGLPVGWTMPSCAFPVTIAQTNCVSLATV